MYVTTCYQMKEMLTIAKTNQIANLKILIIIKINLLADKIKSKIQPKLLIQTDKEKKNIYSNKRKY